MANDKKEWKGGKLGHFHLSRRYKNVATSEGRIYRAQNIQTGAAALVLMPGPSARWEPSRVWRVCASSEVMPPYLAL